MPIKQRRSIPKIQSKSKSSQHKNGEVIYINRRNQKNIQETIRNDMEKLVNGVLLNPKKAQNILSQEWAETLGAPKKKKYINYKVLKEEIKRKKADNLKPEHLFSASKSNTSQQKGNSKPNASQQKKIGNWWSDRSVPTFRNNGNHGRIVLSKDEIKFLSK